MDKFDKAFSLIMAWLYVTLSISLASIAFSIDYEHMAVRILMYFGAALPIVGAMCKVRTIKIAEEEKENDNADS